MPHRRRDDGELVTVHYDPEPRRFIGTGTVFIARDDGPGVWGYWDGLPETGPRALEQLPQGLSLRQAAEWGLERTKRVLVRTEISGYFIVGELDAASDLEVELEGELPLAALDQL